MTDKASERKNVVVVGGAGFLGANLCEFLLERCNVVCVDNFSTGSERNIDQFLANPHFELIRHDITQELDFKAIDALDKFHVAYTGISQIYHCAGPGAPTWIEEHPIETMMTHAQGTKQVLDIARTFGASVVYVSDLMLASSESRTSFTDTPMEAYRESKRFSELLCESYRALYSMPCAIVRLGSTYGPHMGLTDGRFIATVIGAALKDLPLEIPSAFSRGSFLYVRDAVEGLEKIVDAAGSGIFEMSSVTEYAISEIMEKIIHLTASSSKVVPQDMTARAAFWMAQSGQGDLSSLTEGTGWFPVVVLDDGLVRTIDFLKAQLHVKTMTS